MAEMLRKFLIVSNLLCFCFHVVLFVLLSLGFLYEPSSSQKFGSKAVSALLLSITNVVALRYLFNRLKSGAVKSIFTFFNAINVIAYIIVFLLASMALKNYGARLAFGSEYAFLMKLVVFLPLFLALVSALNFLMMAGHIKIHKAHDPDHAPTDYAQGTPEPISGRSDAQAGSGKKIRLPVFQNLRGKKLYAAVLVVTLSCLLLFWGARDYFATWSNPLYKDTGSITFEWLIEPKYHYKNIGGFYSDMIWIREDEKAFWKLINKTGKVLVDGFEAESIFPYDEETGLAPFEDVNPSSAGILGRTSGMIGYVNISGDVVVPPQYLRGGLFRHGMAVVSKEANGKIVSGVIDHRGDVVISFDVMSYLHIVTPNLLAFIKDQNWHAINKKGEIMFNITSDPNSDTDIRREPIHSDYVAYQINRREIFYVLPPNILGIHIEGKEGLMDDSGKWILPASYDRVFEGGDGLIGVEKDGKVGFVDAKGKTVIDFKFFGTMATGHPDKNKKLIRRRVDGPLYVFSEGRAIVLLSEIPSSSGKISYEKLSYGVIDTMGNIVFEFQGIGSFFKNGFMPILGSHKALTLIDRFGKRHHKVLPLNAAISYLTWESPSEGLIVTREASSSGNKLGYLKFKIDAK